MQDPEVAEDDLSSQSELRSYPQINSAVDSINNKIYELRRDVDSMMVLHYLILGYADGKLNEDEVARLRKKFENANAENIRKFCSLIEDMTTKEGELISITRMVEELESGRWSVDET